MLSLNWITCLHRSWITVGLFLSTVVTSVVSACPKDVPIRAQTCFTAYSSHFQNMQTSPHKLCCGVDVEILRAFCHSYMSAVSCVNDLKRNCPDDTHYLIEKALINLDGAKAGLTELCSDDSLIEDYAMYQSCFTMVGKTSELCFQTHLNGTSTVNIRFLSTVSTAKMDQFCNDMRNTVNCVQRNIKTSCGDKAARLAAVLVKPMVRQSTDCDYSVINAQQKTTKRPYHNHHAYISDEHGIRNDGAQSTHNSGINLLTSAPYFVIVGIASLTTAFISSHQILICAFQTL